MKGEVYPGQEHENGNNSLEIGVVIVGNTCISGTKSSGGHCAECVTHGIKEGHPPDKQEANLHQGDKKIDARLQFVHHRTRDLSLVKLHSSYTEEGKNGNGEHNNPHTSHPLREASPEQYSLWERFDIVQNRGPCGCKAGKRFKKGIGKCGNRTRKQKGERAKKTSAQPAEGDDGYALSLTERGVITCSGNNKEDEANSRGNHKSIEDRKGAPIGIDERDAEGCKHGKTDEDIEDSDEPEDLPKTH
ncbi:hypothetical protein ES705_23733 [subsurface metagenome]